MVIHVQMRRAFCPICDCDRDVAVDTRNQEIERCVFCGQDVWNPKPGRTVVCTEQMQWSGYDERPEWSEVKFVFEEVVSIEQMSYEDRKRMPGKRAAKRARRWARMRAAELAARNEPK